MDLTEVYLLLMIRRNKIKAQLTNNLLVAVVAGTYSNNNEHLDPTPQLHRHPPQFHAQVHPHPPHP